MRKLYSSALIVKLLLLAPASAVADFRERLATASASTGENLFLQCAACHSVDKNGAAGIGPNLYGIINSPVARSEDFDHSTALTEYGGNWDPDRLDASARANVIAYLNTLSDQPVQFIGTKLSATESEEPSALQVGSLFHAPGAEKTYYACTTCHSEMIVAQQGLPRSEWDKMLGWMVEEQGMNPLEEADRNEILDYLSAHYNVDRPNFPR